MTDTNGAATAVEASGQEPVTDPDVFARLDGATLETIVDALGALVAECRLEFDEQGLSVAATDPAVVASVTVDVEADAFETYRATEGTFGLDVERFGTIVGLADRDQPVTLAVDAGTRRLYVSIGELQYTMGLLDPETIRSPPDAANMRFEYAGGVVVEGATIDRSVAATDLVADHLTIGLDGETLYVTADGDVDSVALSLSGDELVDVSSGAAESLYSLDYLGDMSRAIPADAAVDVQLGTETPISLAFEIADGDGSVEYVLSPRIARN